MGTYVSGGAGDGHVGAFLRIEEGRDDDDDDDEGIFRLNMPVRVCVRVQICTLVNTKTEVSFMHINQSSIKFIHGKSPLTNSSFTGLWE